MFRCIRQVYARHAITSNYIFKMNNLPLGCSVVAGSAGCLFGVIECEALQVRDVPSQSIRVAGRTIFAGCLGFSCGFLASVAPSMTLLGSLGVLSGTLYLQTTQPVYE